MDHSGLKAGGMDRVQHLVELLQLLLGLRVVGLGGVELSIDAR